MSNVLKIANPNIQYQFVDYEEHALRPTPTPWPRPTWSSPMRRATTTGVGVDSDITMASVYALITAVNRENKVKQLSPPMKPTETARLSV